MLLRLALLLVATAVLAPLDAAAQSRLPDSAGGATAKPHRRVRLASVVVTATRTAKEIEDVAVPISVVSAEEIERQGALRLGDVLAAVPGLHLFDDHGTGLQVQGFDPDYTLILIDGQPVIGRTSGTLSLNRLTVQGVERVELVRGPSSSLYGSEALAGVVNIITAKPSAGMSGSLSLRGGTYWRSVIAAEAEMGSERSGVRLLVNRYASNGYDMTPDSFAPTIAAFSDWTTDVRAHTDLTDRVRLKLGVRAAIQDQNSAFDSGGARFDNDARRTDWSIHPEAEIRLSNVFRLRTTLYGAQYKTETRHTRQADGALTYSDDFDQRLARAETQVDALWGQRHLTVIGAGLTDERLESTRYAFGGSQPEAQQAYVFLQHEWAPVRAFEINASARFDAHTDYASQVSPKLSVLVRPFEALSLRASLGSGFKAPAFRQLYLNFTNPTAGYSVLGTTLLRDGLQEFVDLGIVDPSSITIDVDAIEPIEAESSSAFNVGATVTPTRWLTASVNAFHNDVENLIDTEIVAFKNSNNPIFSYRNFASVYTRGIEAETTILPLDLLGASASHRAEVRISYQFLQARDREIVDQIEDGVAFARDANNRDIRLSMSDYGGLFGRSPHSTTMQVNYGYVPFDLDASLRMRYRSDYGYVDLDGNQIPYGPNEFVDGYGIVDATLSKTVPTRGSTSARLQVGVDNLFDVTRVTSRFGPMVALVPSQPGRRY
ncbi:MAG: TonB-dependent receptor, partial [Bacteroidota bacterium]